MEVEYITCDCLNLPLKDNSVDLVFTSPPYEDCRTYGIDFNLRGDEWVEWAVPRFLEQLRVCRGLVAWVVEGKTKRFRWSAVPAKLMVELDRRGVCLRKPPAFHRVGIPGSGGPDWLRNDYEFIVCATNGGKLPWSENTACGHVPKYAPGGELSYRTQDGARINKEKGHKRKSTVNQWGGSAGSANARKKDGTRQSPGRPSHVHPPKLKRMATRGTKNGDTKTEQCYLPPKLANPGNIIQCAVGGGQMGHDLAHENEAPFPLKLAEFFVKSFCPPGGIVLDPFCGSGTVGHAAMLHGRNAVLCDIRDSQIELSKRRIESLV